MRVITASEVMESTGNFKCPTCGRVHFGISEEDALQEISAITALRLDVSDDEKSYFSTTPTTIESYKQCFQCGHPNSDFVPARSGDAPPLATLQSIIDPTK